MILTKQLAVLGILGLTTGLVTYGAPAPALAAETAQMVKITASKFHFTPDRIVLAKGQPVTLQLTSADRTHGFMVRAFGIDTDIEPGKTTAITIKPEKAGTYTTICDHYCGLGHGGMKMTIVVQEATAKSSSAPVLTRPTRYRNRARPEFSMETLIAKYHMHPIIDHFTIALLGIGMLADVAGYAIVALLGDRSPRARRWAID